MTILTLARQWDNRIPVILWKLCSFFLQGYTHRKAISARSNTMRSSWKCLQDSLSFLTILITAQKALSFLVTLTNIQSKGERKF